MISGQPSPAAHRSGDNAKAKTTAARPVPGDPVPEPPADICPGRRVYYADGNILRSYTIIIITIIILRRVTEKWNMIQPC